MTKLKTTREISDLSTDFLWNLQFCYKDLFWEIRQELTKRTQALKEPLVYKKSKWKINSKGQGSFVKMNHKTRKGIDE